MPAADAAELLARYQRVRRARVCESEPDEVFVLSRVTLGADIKVTSMVLDAARKRFPNARLSLVGSAKSAELFEANSEIHHVRVEYPRAASLPQKLAAGVDLARKIDAPNSIVIDPDSRLTQLGLLPICAEANYFFFESRSYGGNGTENLSALTRRWLWNTFDVEAHANIVPLRVPTEMSRPFATVSFGVGDNPAKMLGPHFEGSLLRTLGELFQLVWVDAGAGGDEAGRVQAAVVASGLKDRCRTWTGSFAGFSSLIAQSKFYLGYDSAGQHAAAAFGIPLVSVFAGFVSDRMLERWRPAGCGSIEVVSVSSGVAIEVVLNNTIRAMNRMCHLN